MEEEVGCDILNGAGGASVEKIGGGVECFDPKWRGEVGLEEECPNDIVGSANEPFGFAILRGCMRA